MLSSNLRLGNDQLQRVATVRLVDGVLQDADRLQQVSGNLGLAREIRWVGQNLLGLGGEAHGFAAVIPILHGGLDSRNLAVLIEDLIDVGVKHVGTSVDSRQTSEALRELTQTVERVDVGRLAVAGHRVHVQADAVDGIGGHSTLSNIVVGLIQGHGVANEVTGVFFQAEFVIDFLHGALSNVQAYTMLAVMTMQTPRPRSRTLVSTRVVFLEFANPFEKFLGPPLLEHAHER